MKWITKGLWNFANFKGRAGASECLTFVFFVFVCLAATFGVDLAMGWGQQNVVDWVLWYPTFETTRMVLVLPFFAVTVRRLHDVNKSGWMALLWCVPIIGWAYLMMFLVQDGHEGLNRHGAPPEEASSKAPVGEAS